LNSFTGTVTNDGCTSQSIRLRANN
jgi:hypothetical protein